MKATFVTAAALILSASSAFAAQGFNAGSASDRVIGAAAPASEAALSVTVDASDIFDRHERVTARLADRDAVNVTAFVTDGTSATDTSK